MRRQPALFAIFAGGLIAGAFDLTYAIVFSGFRGVPALRILQSVASGLLGAAAYQGGWPVAAIGLMLHFVIACLAAAIFYLASRRLPFLLRHAAISGLCYGLAIYAVMNLVVLPLSAFPNKVSFAPLLLTTGLFVHAVFVGVPIALAARHAAGPPAVTPDK